MERNWGSRFKNVAILVGIAVNEHGYREVLGAAEEYERGQGQTGKQFLSSSVAVVVAWVA